MSPDYMRNFKKVLVRIQTRKVCENSSAIKEFKHIIATESYRGLFRGRKLKNFENRNLKNRLIMYFYLKSLRCFTAGL